MYTVFWMKIQKKEAYNLLLETGQDALWSVQYRYVAGIIET